MYNEISFYTNAMLFRLDHYADTDFKILKMWWIAIIESTSNAKVRSVISFFKFEKFIFIFLFDFSDL